MRRHPDWLKVKIPSGENYNKIKKLLNNHKLHTVCQVAKCPNTAECWDKGTATFLILGDTCTRNCHYCNVKHSIPKKVNNSEPKDIAKTVKELNLNYAVITSVTRDDLEDGGAKIFAQTIKEIKKAANCKVEVLTPDFKGNKSSIKTVAQAKPDVFTHNIEVTQNLFSKIRPEADYNRSLNFLKDIKDINKSIKTKSGIMIGFGETKQDIIKTMKDLRDTNCNIFTIGQYLQPTKTHRQIKKYYTPEEFKELKKIAYKLGFESVHSGPLVRSSYHAEKVFQ
jgi:lipoic acid synthetase